MCGIVGLVGEITSADQQALQVMRDAMRHRGPDDAGAWSDRFVALGHRRLSIIDLSPTGHQPMHDRDGRYVLVLNGEIYNYRALREELESLGHRFLGTSDTEVLIEAYRAWGNGCLDRLNGMYAFALYDRIAGKLLLARDRAGEKPLYYARQGRRIAFASELKALLAVPDGPRTIDRSGLECFLAYGHLPRERCIIAGVRKLCPASALEIDVSSGCERHWRYWELPAPSGAQAYDTVDLIEELDRLLVQSVRLRLLSSDVPVGILLSGGIDSSLVAAAAARAVPDPVRTFTVSFPGAGVYDETAYARIVSSHLGTRHTELVAEAASLELLPTLARQFDEPSVDSSMIPSYLVSRVIRAEAKVALGGDGGDELFGGYAWHRHVQWQSRVRRYLPAPLRSMGRGLVDLLPLGTPGRNVASGFFLDEAHAISRFNMLFDLPARRALLRSLGGVDGDLPGTIRRELIPEAGSPLQKTTVTDFHSYMVDDILTKVDRASMLASLEVRAPFLDRDIIEFAFRDVPDSLRATSRRQKILPKELASRLLPSSLDIERKRGFSVPLARWMREGWEPYMRDVLQDPGQRIFDAASLERLFRDQAVGLRNEHRLFALTMFELWRREYGLETVA